MDEPACGRSPELDRARELLFSHLPADEGWKQIDAAVDGAANDERWERIERIAREEDLDAALVAELRRLLAPAAADS